MALADLDGNGDFDAVVPSKDPDRIELIDLDGDGDLDALTTEENFGPESLGLGAILV